jgi:hypothetical protein
MKNWTIAALLLTISIAAQTPGTVLPAGSAVNLSEFGVSFQVPQGWTSTAQDLSGAFGISRTDGNMAGYLFLKAGVSQSDMTAGASTFSMPARECKERAGQFSALLPLRR